jgi:hypothetical protein
MNGRSKRAGQFKLTGGNFKGIKASWGDVSFEVARHRLGAHCVVGADAIGLLCGARRAECCYLERHLRYRFKRALSMRSALPSVLSCFSGWFDTATTRPSYNQCAMIREHA